MCLTVVNHDAVHHPRAGSFKNSSCVATVEVWCSKEKWEVGTELGFEDCLILPFTCRGSVHVDCPMKLLQDEPVAMMGRWIIWMLRSSQSFLQWQSISKLRGILTWRSMQHFSLGDVKRTFQSGLLLPGVVSNKQSPFYPQHVMIRLLCWVWTGGQTVLLSSLPCRHGLW